MRRILSPIASRFVIIVPYAWLLVFFLVPFLIVLKISLSQTAIAIPPYLPVFGAPSGWWKGAHQFSFDNYLWILDEAPYWKTYLWSALIALIPTALMLHFGFRRAPGTAMSRTIVPALVVLTFVASCLTFALVIRDATYVRAYLKSISIAFISTGLMFFFGYRRAPLSELLRMVLLMLSILTFLISFLGYLRIVSDALYVSAYFSSVVIAFNSTMLTLMIGYPIAYGMARAPATLRPTLLMLVILPFWTSFLIRVYAWIGILKPEGLFNQFLLALGVIDEPLIILNTHAAIFIGIVYSYLPFMVLPVYSALEKMDNTLIEAAQDLGCRPVSAFWKITFPLSIPGVVAGCFLVFIPAVGEFVIPDLLGGSQTLMIGKVLWNEFFANRDWPVASAVAICMLLLLVIPIVIFQNAQARAQEAGR